MAKNALFLSYTQSVFLQWPTMSTLMHQSEITVQPYTLDYMDPHEIMAYRAYDIPDWDGVSQASWTGNGYVNFRCNPLLILNKFNLDLVIIAYFIIETYEKHTSSFCVTDITTTYCYSILNHTWWITRVNKDDGSGCEPSLENHMQCIFFLQSSLIQNSGQDCPL